MHAIQRYPFVGIMLMIIGVIIMLVSLSDLIIKLLIGFLGYKLIDQGFTLYSGASLRNKLTIALMRRSWF